MLKISRVGLALAAYRPDPGQFAVQLGSIADQTFRDWRCVITFDSPIADLDGVRELDRFRPDADPRFEWLENPARLGHKKNFERAIVLAAQGADAVGCSDQDDLWYPEKLRRSVEALEAAGPLSLVHTDMHRWDGVRKDPETVWTIERRGVAHVSTADLLVRNVVAGCSMLLDAELVRRYPRIPDGAEYHDHWYALVASRFGGVHPIHEPLFAYRQHGGNVVGATPFRGAFHIPSGSTARSLLEKCRAAWRRSAALASAAEAENLPLPPELRRGFSSGGDRGARLLWNGLRLLAEGDPSLGRACLARAVGKAVGG